MTASKVIPFDVALQREDRRLAQRRERVAATRRKLLPIMVLVCETYSVTPDEVCDSSNRHPKVLLARDIVRWLGWSRLHIGTTYLGAALNQDHTTVRTAVRRLQGKQKPDFVRQVECIEKLYDAQVKK